MRLAAIILSLVAACKSEPTFDQRYEAAEEKIRSTAKEIDQEIATRASQQATDAPADQAENAEKQAGT